MTGLLRRASLRFYLRHPWQLGLAIAGISLGVGVYVGVSLANDSAARAFDVAATAVRGPITHRLLPLDGALDDRSYRELVVRDGTLTAAPVVEGEVGLPGRPGLRVPLLGIDPVLGADALRMAQLAPPRAGDIARLIVEPGTVLLPEELAGELGISSGDSTTLTIGRRDAVVRVIGLMPAGSADVAAEPPIVADIATAQELLGTGPPRPHRSRADRSASARARRSSACRRHARRGRDRGQRLSRADRGVPHELDGARPAGARRRHVPHLRHDGLRDPPTNADARYPADARRVSRRDPSDDSLGGLWDSRRRDGDRARARPRPRDRPRGSRAANDRRPVVQRRRRRRRSIAVDLRARCGARVRRNAARRGQARSRCRANRAGRRTAPRRARAARARGGSARGLCRVAGARRKRPRARVRPE